MNTRPAVPPTIDILATWSPLAVDTVLSAIWAEISHAESVIESETRTIASIVKRNGGTLENAIGWDRESHERAVTKLATANATLDRLNVEADPYEDSYRARRWSRYFLVDNVNGHVHTSRSCSTCFLTTRYRWLVELAGQDEAACVALVGESACTVCMPSAPTRPGFADGTSGWARKTQAEKDEVARVKAEKLAAKSAKAITDVDGGRLMIDGWHIATLAAANKAIVDAMDTSGSANADYLARQAADRDHLAAAIAHKTGESVADVLQAAQRRLAARRKREGR